MKTAIVTGASKGVGYQTCKLLLKNNYHVIAISRNIKRMSSLGSENIDLYQMDITRFDEIKKFSEKYQDTVIDLLINNAGGGMGPTEIIKEDPNNFNYAYSLNVSGPMYLSSLLTKNMEKSENPTIIFVSSLGGKFAYPSGGNYTNAKRAIGGLVDTMRIEYPQYGIKITEVCPGTIDTIDGESRNFALTADDMAQTMLWVAEMPRHVNINYIELNHVRSGKF
jgi:3-hydroxy acid dehydrogenase / malonic semialdehyde reductase